jgi:hypothetical protein
MVDIPVKLRLSVDQTGLKQISKALGGSFMGGVKAGYGGMNADAGGALGKMGKAFGTMGTVGLMAKGIGELNRSMKSMFRYSPAMAQSMKALETSFFLIMKPIGDFIGMMLRPVMKWLMKWIMDNKGLATGIIAVIAAIKGLTLLVSGIKALKSFVGGGTAAITGAGAAGATIAAKISGAFTAAGGIIASIATAIKGAIVAGAGAIAGLGAAGLAIPAVGGALTGAFIVDWLMKEGQKNLVNPHSGASVNYQARPLPITGLLAGQEDWRGDVSGTYADIYKWAQGQGYKGEYDAGQLSPGRPTAESFKKLETWLLKEMGIKVVNPISDAGREIELGLVEANNALNNFSENLNRGSQALPSWIDPRHLKDGGMDFVSGISYIEDLTKASKDTTWEVTDLGNGTRLLGDYMQTAASAVHTFGKDCLAATSTLTQYTKVNGEWVRSEFGAWGTKAKGGKMSAAQKAMASGDSPKNWRQYAGKQTGGPVIDDGWHYLHKGETVHPAYRGGDSHINTAPVIIYANVQNSTDIDELARKISERDFQKSMRF